MELKKTYEVTTIVKLENIETCGRIHNTKCHAYILTDRDGNSEEYATFGQLVGKIKKTPFIHLIVKDLDKRDAWRLEDIVSEKFLSSSELCWTPKEYPDPTHTHPLYKANKVKK